MLTWIFNFKELSILNNLITITICEEVMLCLK